MSETARVLEHPDGGLLWKQKAMTENDTAAEKSIVEQLSFGAKTSKRVAWEAWEFTVVGPHQVKVINASYGFEKDDHAYVVGVEERDGLALPAECDCPADKYSDDYDCKHKVALATVGGPTVLNAAVEYESSARAVPTERETMADGGVIGEETRGDVPSLGEDDHEECDCADLPADFPCWSCVRDGKREFPE